jgi:hypothetical protein
LKLQYLTTVSVCTATKFAWDCWILIRVHIIELYESPGNGFFVVCQ